MISAISMSTPRTWMTTAMPRIWRAMYGIVATIPVIATARANVRLSNRSLT